MKPIATTYLRFGFMVRSEGVRVCCDFNGLQRRTTSLGAFRAPKVPFGTVAVEQPCPMRGQVGSPLITVWLQVRVLPDPLRISVTYFVFVARIATTARLIVAR
jgi:hypothetical protein